MSALLLSDSLGTEIFRIGSLITDKEVEWLENNVRLAEMLELIGTLVFEPVEDAPDKPDGDTWTFSRVVETLCHLYSFHPDQILDMSKFEISELLSAANERVDEQKRGSGRREKPQQLTEDQLKGFFGAGGGISIKDG